MSEEQAQNQNSQSDIAELFDLPIDSKIMFTNHKNIYKNGIEKHQTKWLKKAGFIKTYLKEDEKILLISSACSPMGILEQLVTGWIVYYLKRCLLIFTNQRIIHVPTKSDFSFKDSISQVKYSDLKRLTAKGHVLTCQYPGKKKEAFYYLEGKMRKKLRFLTQELVQNGEQNETGKRTHLCPKCQHELEEGRYECPNCNLAFKSKAQAKKISWLYPGGGYFFTHHPLLGLSDALVEIFLILVVLSSLDGVIKGVPGAMTDFIIFGIFLIMEKLYTVYETNHFIDEYIPIKDK